MEGYIMLIASDVQLTPETLNKMIDHMQAEPKIGVVTPMLFVGGKGPRWYGERHAPEAQSLPWYEACAKNVDIPCEYVTTNLLLIRREILERGTRFNETRHSFEGEDHVFTGSIYNQGWIVLYCTHCRYYHPPPPGATARVLKGMSVPPAVDYCKGQNPKPPSYPRPVERIDVITVTYNQLPYIKRMVDSLRFINCPFRLIIVDNGSEQDTIDYLKTLDAKVIYEKGNKSVFRALNIGIEEALIDLK